MATTSLRTTPPGFCQYIEGKCDQDFSTCIARRASFLFPSEPIGHAATITRAVEQLQAQSGKTAYVSWREFPSTGRMIVCEICKSIRHSEYVVADVTELNFNVMFELGIAIGVGAPVLPLRDTSWKAGESNFRALGLIETLGYKDYTSSNDIVRAVREFEASTPSPIPMRVYAADRASPIYYLKSRSSTDQSLRLTSDLKKSRLHFRTFDPIETARLPLGDAVREVSRAFGVVVHLAELSRDMSVVDNARSALVAGIALARGMRVLIIASHEYVGPIDYRDLIQRPVSLGALDDCLEGFTGTILEDIQGRSDSKSAEALSPLASLDLGDLAAENEIRQLRSYFVTTGQFQEAKRGHARLVVGRKGAGKTCLFYMIRDAFQGAASQFVLDLKPEGHQFRRLQEAVLHGLTPGVQEHTVTAFWDYVLLCELAYGIIKNRQAAISSEDSLRKYELVRSAYDAHQIRRVSDTPVQRIADFPERLMAIVDRMAANRQAGATTATNLVYTTEIRPLEDAVVGYLSDKQGVWLLVDNLDKAWPTREASAADILVLRCLLEAARKRQRRLSNLDLEFNCIVFLRNDIHQQLIREMPDAGKETATLLSWDDRALFERLVQRRIEASLGQSADFGFLWSAYFAPTVRGRPSFHFVLDRTLLRPRDVLALLKRGIETALNRGHMKVLSEDLEFAAKQFSGDMLQELLGEVRGAHERLEDLIYEFLGSSRSPTRREVATAMLRAGIQDGPEAERLLELLLWFSFLGVVGREEKESYSYDVAYDIGRLRRLQLDAGSDGARFVIHEAFHDALEIV